MLIGCYNSIPLRYDILWYWHVICWRLELLFLEWWLPPVGFCLRFVLLVTTVAFSRLRISLFLFPNAEILEVMDHCDLMSSFCASSSEINEFWAPSFSKYIRTDFLNSIPYWCHSIYSESRVKLEWLLSLMLLFGLRALWICNSSHSEERQENWELRQIRVW